MIKLLVLNELYCELLIVISGTRTHSADDEQPEPFLWKVNQPFSRLLAGDSSSLLPALAGLRVLLRRRGVAAFPQQRCAEDADDAQVEDEAGDQHPDGPQERGHGRVGQERRPPGRHVRQHALHLEVGPHHGADVEELVTVAKVVKASRGQPLREVGGKQETCEEGKDEVVTVTGQGVARAAASPAAHDDPVKQRSRVEYEGQDERSRPQSFTPLWELQLQEPGVAGQTGAEHRVRHGNGDKVLMEPAVHPAVRYDIVAVAYSATQTVEAERAVVKEVADVARLRGHGAEGVRTAGGEGVHADEHHVHQQGPGVAVGQEVHRGAEDEETPQEVPCWQEVGPDVDRLVVHLEAAEDAVQRRAPGVAVPRDDAVLPEHLGDLVDVKELGKLDAEHVCGQSDGTPPSLTDFNEPGSPAATQD